MAEKHEQGQSGGRPLWKRRSFWLGGGALAGLAGLVAVAPRVWAFHGMGGHGFAGHGFAGHGFAGHGRFAFGAQILNDPEAAKRHADLAVEWALRGVQASDQQMQQAKGIAERLVDDLAPLAAKHHERHKAIVAELTKTEIDRSALEELRKQELELADQASRVLVGSFADLGAVLTPQQRQELIDFARRMHAN